MPSNEDGNNGPAGRFEEEEAAAAAAAPAVPTEVTRDQRERIARVRNVVTALAKAKLVIFYSSIVICYDDSEHLPVREILSAENRETVVGRAQAACTTGEW